MLEWLPITIHALDTMSVMQGLWNIFLCDSQRSIVIDSLSTKNESDAFKLISFLGYIHDIGKITPVFQLKRNNFIAGQKDLDDILTNNIFINVYRPKVEWQPLFEKESHHSITGAALLSYFGISNDIATIVCSHHGKIPEYLIDFTNQTISYKENLWGSNTDTNEQNIWKSLQETFIKNGLKKSGLSDLPADIKISEEGQILLSGLLIMSDWIASNSLYFPLIGLNESIKNINYETRRNNGFNKWLESDFWEPEYIGDLNNEYKEVFSFLPNQYQSKVNKILSSLEKPGIMILELPTGSGKTEAALMAADIFAYKSGANGFFFGLPTQATSNAILPRIEDWVTKKESNHFENYVLQLAHGKANLNKNYKAWTELEGYSERSWYGGTKTKILSDFVVGTIDNFLLMSLKSKHLALRHLGFSKKVVILDEAHAYDIFMSTYMYQSIKWLAAYGVPVIILSATLPSDKREKLVRSYMKGLGIKWRDVDKVKYLQNPGYPAITYSDGSSVKSVNNFNYNGENQKEITINKVNKNDLEKLLLKLHDKSGIKGVIVNSVKKAQEIARFCEDNFGEDSFLLLHSAIISSEKAKIENQLLSEIGKNGNRPKSKFYIGTQLLEQSLDIDFDCLITELCPVDLLIQRIGRVHRHNIDRPTGFSQPICYLINTGERLTFDKASAYIYSTYILARTEFFLKEKILVPADVSLLIENVYNDTNISFNDISLQEKYLKYKNEYKIKMQVQEEKAKFFRLRDPNKKVGSTMLGLTSDVLSSTKVDVLRQVRDTEETIEVIALKKYGEDSYKSLNGDKVFNAPFSKAESFEILKESIKLPQALTKQYNVGNTIKFLEDFNIKNCSDLQNNSILKGELFLIFNDKNEFLLNDCLLTYNNTYGLESTFIKDGDIKSEQV